MAASGNGKERHTEATEGEEAKQKETEGGKRRAMDQRSGVARRQRFQGKR